MLAPAFFASRTIDLVKVKLWKWLVTLRTLQLFRVDDTIHDVVQHVRFACTLAVCMGLTVGYT